MAQSALNQDDITCAICLDLLQVPVTLPCGHSYCMDCIQNHWDQQVRVNCPQCRESFSPRPALVKSTVLAHLVEELKKTGLTARPSEQCYAGPGDVSCDLCSGRKLKAVKSCLQCLVSYCESHLQPHHEVAMFQKHQLVAPFDRLQENICSQHNKLMEIFCHTDEQIICYLCSMDQHKGHETVSSAAERAQRQEQLLNKRTQFLQSLQDKENMQKRLRQEAQDIRRSAQTAVQRSDDSFRELTLLMDKRRSEVEQKIRSEEQNQLQQIQKCQDELQLDITELKKTISELDSLCLTPDHNHFIQLCPPLLKTTHNSESQTESRLHTKTGVDFADITRAVTELKDKLLLTLRDFKPEPINLRKDLIRYASNITLDPNTANKYLSLSEGNRRATNMIQMQKYPDHPDRFFNWTQVMSREGLIGKCYFEVELTWMGKVFIGLTYKDISRTGGNYTSLFGKNDKSWALECKNDQYAFWSNNVRSVVMGPVSNRVGVYLDHSAGALSFYSVKDETMVLLHRIQTTFTQPLYAGLWIYSDTDTACFPKLQ